MYIKQVRTKSNSFSTVRYDKDGNILTPARKKQLKQLPKKNHKKNTKGPKWLKLVSKFSGICCVCNYDIVVGTEIMWNKKNKKIKHKECSK
jgi:hypothetical protein